MAVLRVEADDGFGVQIVALARAAVPIVARRADRQIDQTAAIVDAERRPDVRVASRLPRFVRPRLGAVVSFVAAASGLKLHARLPDFTSNAWTSPGGSFG